MSDAFDPYLQWLGIRDPQRPPNHYRLLGIDLFENDPEIIQSAFDRQMSHVRKFQTGRHAAWSQQLLNELATAKITLLHAARKADYDAWLHQSLTTPYADPSQLGAEPVPASEEVLFTLPPNDSLPPRRMTGLLVGLSLTAVLLLAGIAALLVWRDRLARDVAHAGPQPALTSPAGAPNTTSLSPTEPAPIPSSLPAPPPTPRPVSPLEPAPASPPVSSPEEPASPAASGDVGPAVRSEQSLGELMTDPDSNTAAPSTAPVDVSAESPVEIPVKEPPGAAPIPEASAQERMRTEIRRIFEQEYAAADTPDEKRGLAELLVKQAMETGDDPVAYYVLLTEARDLAADAGDSRTFLQSLVALSRKFPIDWVTMAAEGLEQAAKRSRSPAANASLARTALKLIDGAIRDDQFPQAVKLATAGRDLARKAADAGLLKEAVERLKDVEIKQQSYTQYIEAGQRLEANPEDADARRIQATYLCFVKGDWEQGLPLLAKSGDSTLVALAEAEAVPPEDAASAVALGDLWWEASRSADPALRSGMLSRTTHWYRAARPYLRGLTQTKVERRLEQIAAGGP